MKLLNIKDTYRVYGAVKSNLTTVTIWELYILMNCNISDLFC